MKDKRKDKEMMKEDLIKDMEKTGIKLRKLNPEVFLKLSEYETRDLVKAIYAGRYEKFEELEPYYKTRLNKILTTDFIRNLPDVDKFTNIMEEVITKNLRVIHVCDYDVDGVTSGAIAYKMYKHLFNMDNFEVIPNRREYGNGINDKIVEMLVRMYEIKPFDVLVTSDHGSHDRERFEYLKEKLGIKIVVTDHHLYDISNTVSTVADAFINPQRLDSKMSKHITGANVIYFSLLYAYLNLVKKYPELEEIKYPTQFDNKVDYYYYLLTYVGMTIVSDVVSLKDYINRKILIKALKDINSNVIQHDVFWTRVRENLTTSYFIDEVVLGFEVVPKLNAAGRIDNPSLALELMIAEDLDDSEVYLNEIEDLNDKRKELQIEALKREDKVVYKTDNVLVALIKNTEGLQGIIANNILFSEGYNVVICFTEHDRDGEKVLIGSGRLSGNKANLKEILDKIYSRSDVIIKHGGHKQAVGVKIKPDLENFFNLLVEEVSKEDLSREETIYVDDIIYSNKRLFTNLFDVRAAGPYGQGFPRPLFASDVYIHSFRVFTKNGKKYLKAKLKFSQLSDFKVSMFYTFTKEDLDNKLDVEIRSIKKIRIVYAISVSTYMSSNSILLNVEKMLPLD